MNKDNWESDVERQDDNTVDFSVTVPEDDVESFRSRAINELKPEVDEPGFREGKAPEGLIKKKYPQQVDRKLLEVIVPEICDKVYREHDLEPVSRPQLNDFDIEDEVTVDVTVEIRPEIDVPEDVYSEISLRKVQQSVDDESVEEQIEELREQAAELQPITDERPIQSGDFAKLDFEGFDQDGEPVEGTDATDTVMEIGSERFLPELEEGLLGAEVGDHKTIQATLPDDFVEEDLAGETLDFEVDVLEIQEEKKPPVSDAEFLDEYDVDSPDKLREQVRERLGEMGEDAEREQLSEQIYDHLIGELEFELPESLVENEQDFMLRDLKQRMEAQDRDFDDYLQQQGKTEEELKQEVRPEAERRIRLTLIFQEIADQEEIEVSDEEFENHLDELSNQYGISVDELKQNIPDQEMDSIRMELRDDHILDYLIEHADIEIVEEEELKESDEEDDSLIETPSGI